MFDRFFRCMYSFVDRHKVIVFVSLIFVTLGALCRMGSISFDNSIESMLPDNKEVHRTVQFFREASLSGKAILSFELVSEKRSVADLIRVADAFVADIDVPYITKVTSGVAAQAGLADIASLMKYAPQLLSIDDLRALDEMLTPTGIEKLLEERYRELIMPTSMLSSQFMGIDPFGIKRTILKRFERSFSTMGKNVTIVQGHFVSSDNKHLMVILETAVPITDGAGSRNLLRYLHERTERLPDFVTLDIIAGHNHSVSNEKIIKRDVFIVLAVAAVGFLLVFVWVFKDVRFVSLLVIPLVSALLAVNVCSLIFSSVSYFILGMGGVIAGIAVDYGIHVYTAVSAKSIRFEAVRTVAKPVLIGALTTIGVFVAFLFSGVIGYAQLAVVAIVSIVASLCFSFFVLPFCLKPLTLFASKQRIDLPRTYSRQTDIVVFSIWFTCIAVLLIVMRGILFNNDVMQYDGTAAEIMQSERTFNSVWGIENEPAVLVVEGSSLDSVFSVTENIYSRLESKSVRNQFSTLVSVLPSVATRRGNLDYWNNFWLNGNEERARRLLREKSSLYGFDENAFSPFFESLYMKDDTLQEFQSHPILAALQDQFLVKTDGGYQLLSFFPDTEEFVSDVEYVCSMESGSFVVSRKAFSSLLSRSIAAKIFLVSLLVVVFIPLITMLLLRDVRLILLALLPVVSSVVMVFAGVHLLGFAINVPIVIALLVVLGLCIDYGVFVVYHCHYHTDVQTHLAITVSALTTVIGTGALLFAQHPVLFMIGLTLVLGVSAGYCVSIFVIPSLYRLFVKKGTAYEG